MLPRRAGAGCAQVAMLAVVLAAGAAAGDEEDHAQAALDATVSARQLRAAGLSALLLDTSALPQPIAQALAADLGARYVALPYAGAQGLSQAVRAVAGLPSRAG